MTKRVLYLNVHDRDYPRNARIREHLTSMGAEYEIVDRIDYDSYILTSLRLARRALRVKGPFSAVILSELGVQYALVARIVAWRHRATLVVDAFVGMYESNVLDWARVPRSSPTALIYKTFDILASVLPRTVLVDTDLRRARVRSEGARRIVTLPVGAPAWAVSSGRSNVSAQTEVLYYGNYIPLHGLEYVLESICRLRNPDDFNFVFVGEGEGRPPIEALARKLGIFDRVDFRDSVPEQDLHPLISRAHVVLGVFGESEKAATVIANKVWQGLASGRVVTTRRTAALLELEGHVSVGQLRIVDTSDDEALTRVLENVSRDRLAGDSLTYPNTARALELYVQQRYTALDEII